MKNRFGTEMTVREWLLSELKSFEQIARAAGHGFDYPERTNTGWTQLDLSDNCRPSYDALYLTRVVEPDVMADMLLGLIDLVELHFPADQRTFCLHCGKSATAELPCPSVKLAAQILAGLDEFPDELRIDAGYRKGSIKRGEHLKQMRERWGTTRT